MADIVHDYFQPGWRTRELDCVCGWRGQSRDMAMELHDDVTDYACPRCENLLLIVSHPSLEQVRNAASAGNEEARQQLAIVEEALRQHRPGEG